MMNIQHALNRIRDLQDHEERLHRTITSAQEKVHGGAYKNQFSTYVDTGISRTAVDLDRDQVVDIMQENLNGVRAEIAKLQPVIDMANAALKGILS